jgi:hypothetical protein
MTTLTIDKLRADTAYHMMGVFTSPDLYPVWSLYMSETQFDEIIDFLIEALIGSE